MSSYADSAGCPHRREGVTVVRVDGETLLVDDVNGTQHLLNPTAHALWELCDGSTSVEEMIGAILQLFAVDRGVVRDDVAHALSQLTDLGLLTWR
jgi:hypothetical protein